MLCVIICKNLVILFTRRLSDSFPTSWHLRSLICCCILMNLLTALRAFSVRAVADTNQKSLSKGNACPWWISPVARCHITLRAPPHYHAGKAHCTQTELGPRWRMKKLWCVHCVRLTTPQGPSLVCLTRLISARCITRTVINNLTVALKWQTNYSARSPCHR